MIQRQEGFKALLFETVLINAYFAAALALIPLHKFSSQA
jgi:hypothetical protein